mgnify:CR=1 FL=1
MAYKNAKDNRHNASIAKMMSKVKNPNFSVAKQVEKMKAKPAITGSIPMSAKGVDNLVSWDSNDKDIKNFERHELHQQTHDSAERFDREDLPALKAKGGFKNAKPMTTQQRVDYAEGNSPENQMKREREGRITGSYGYTKDKQQDVGTFNPKNKKNPGKPSRKMKKQMKN